MSQITRSADRSQGHGRPLQSMETVGRTRSDLGDEAISSKEVVIEARDLCKEFGSMTALNRVNFKIRKGELFSFLGPNGAGKTTLMRLLSCVLKPSSGTALVMGYDLRHDSLMIRRRIGIVPQWPSLYMDLSAVENSANCGKSSLISCSWMEWRRSSREPIPEG